MNIDSVNIDKNYFQTRRAENQAKASESPEISNPAAATSVRGDRLEISAAAANLNLQRARVRSGYYNKPEIIKETAERLLQSITQKKEINNSNESAQA